MTSCLESGLLASSGGNEVGGDLEEAEQRKTERGGRGRTSGQGLGRKQLLWTVTLSHINRGFRCSPEA